MLVGVPLIGLSLAVGGAAATGGGEVTNYIAPTINQPEGIAAGPDGALWFTNSGANTIGRITTAGAVSRFTGTGISRPSDIAVGSDGALWFTNFSNNSIGRITTTGAVKNFTNPGISAPYGITAGPDGALWFANVGNKSIGRITTTGTITNFTNPSISGAVGITAGPDGALWFTNCIVQSSAHGPVCSDGGGSIGRITTTGTVTNFTNANISTPAGITVGPDHALWFANFANSSIGRITTSGSVTTYAGAGARPDGIAAGPDGALWFTNGAGDSIGRITTAGVVSTYLDGGISDPIDIAAGSDGALWFTNFTGYSIGRITVPPPSVVAGSASVREGNSGTTNLNVPVTRSYATTRTVTVQWTTGFIPGGPGHQADPATDYIPASGTVTFAAGHTTATVSIKVKGDTRIEPDEYIAVLFGNPTNATMGRIINLGFGVILDND